MYVRCYVYTFTLDGFPMNLTEFNCVPWLETVSQDVLSSLVTSRWTLSWEDGNHIAQFCARRNGDLWRFCQHYMSPTADKQNRMDMRIDSNDVWVWIILNRSKEATGIAQKYYQCRGD